MDEYGQVHSELVRVVEGLRSGAWPPATLELRHCELGISYRGVRRQLVCLDYPGEVFRQAFVQDAVERPGATSPEAEALIRHLDAAVAVLLLIDPASLCGGSVDAVIDDDFGITQAVEYLRNSPGAEDVPVVLVLTKSDQNAKDVACDGTLEAFAKKRLPALARTPRSFRVYQVSAVQTFERPDGVHIPRKDFAPRSIEKPLLHCLDTITKQEECARQANAAIERRRSFEARVRRDESDERRRNRFLAALIVSMIVITGCIIAVIVAVRS